MKRLSILFAIVISIFLVHTNVFASEVLTLNASESETGVISVSGTVEDSMVAAAIMIYDESGNNLVTMNTTQINDDNTFNTSINLNVGTYIVKVADYQGGEFKTVTVSKGENISTTNTDTIKSPNTGDNIIFYVILCICSIGLLSIIIIRYNKKKNK